MSATATIGETWLEHVGLPTGLADSGPVFDESNVCIEAAASGLGVAMGFFPFIGAKLQSGRMVLAHERQIPCRRNCFCVLGSSGVLKARPVLTFYDCLMSEASGGVPPVSQHGSPTQRRKTSRSHQRQLAHS
jgi:LysR family glycine cleavage system transcriptional activator